MEYEANCEALFETFKNTPKGYSIDNEKGLVHLYGNFFFTRKSLKHIAEKRNADTLFHVIKEIISDPGELRKTRDSNRFILSKKIENLSGRPHAVVLEKNKNSPIVIVTVFPTNTQYLEHFEILWRTGVHENGPSICISTLL